MGVGIEYDYGKLLEKIREVLGGNDDLAFKLKIPEKEMKLKLMNGEEFKQEEILLICDILDISYNDIESYFFKIKTQFN